MERNMVPSRENPRDLPSMRRNPPLRDLSTLWTRASQTILARPEVELALDRWVNAGGALAVVGPDGSGRTVALDGAAARLEADWRPWVRVGPGRWSWGPVVRALLDPLLPSAAGQPPTHADLRRRAQAAAARIARRCPDGLWIIADDLHQLDLGTRETLAELSRQEGAHVLIAGPEAPHWAQPVVLCPFDLEAARRLLQALSGGAALPADAVSRLVEETRGMPGRLVTALGEVLNQGALRLSGEEWSWTPPMLRDLGQRSDLTQRVASLSPDAVRVGSVLAVAGEAVDFDDVAIAAELPGARTSAALSELERRSLVRLERGRARCSSQAVARALPRDSRRPVKAICAALAQRSKDRGEPAAGRAGLLAQAADPALANLMGPEAVSDLLRHDPRAAVEAAHVLWGLTGTARMAMAAMRAQVALGQVAAAVAIAESLVSDSRSSTGDLLSVEVLLARCYLEAQADESLVRACVRRARRSLGTEAPPPCLLEVEARLHRAQGNSSQALAGARRVASLPPPGDELGVSAWVALRCIEAQALAEGGHVEAAVERLTASPLPESALHRESLLAEAGQLLWKSGHYLGASRCYEQAATADPESVGVEQVRWMDLSAQSHYHGGDRQRAVHCWDQALAMARRAALPAEAIRIYTHQANALRELARYEEASRIGAEAFGIASTHSLIDLAAAAALAMADIELAQLHHEDAGVWLGRAASLAVPRDQDHHQARLTRRWAELAVLSGDESALEHVQAAVRSATRAEAHRDRCRASALRAICLARAGLYEQVEGALERALAPLREAGAGQVLAEVRLWAAMAWLDAGEPDRAREAASHALAWAEEMGHIQYSQRALFTLERCRLNDDSMPMGAEKADPSAQLAAALTRESDFQAQLQAVLSAMLEGVQADRAFVVLMEGGEARIAAARSAEGASPGKPSTSVLETAIRRQREVIVSDVGERRELRAQHSIMALRVRSAMCMPLFEGDQVYGALYADSRAAGRTELTRATALLRAIAAQAGPAILFARKGRELSRCLREAQAEVERLRRTLLDIADQVHGLRQVEPIPRSTDMALSALADQACEATRPLVEAQRRTG